MNNEINPENFNDIIAKTLQQQRESLYDDPEWTEKNWLHIGILFQAISVGILSADPHHKNYYVPKNFEKVINYYIQHIEEKFKDTVINICLLKIEGINRKILFTCPEVLEWNNIQTVSIISRYDEIPNTKQFMDLEAMIRNTSIYIRDYIRKNKEFDKKFNEKN